ncbi:MAG TPA: glycine cleavage T C-terminal barrel domain-containing protein [Pirellulales bacterium]|nr:glycine cleavage T C-terminal barrel domain-containing protein [Pirellulales bacterium]
MPFEDNVPTAGGCPAAPGPLAVAHFGDPRSEYAALTGSAGLVDLRGRTRIELAGADRATFLHNLCTNEIKKLAVGAGCEAFLLDARGHVLAHLFVICRPDSLVLETVPGQEAFLLTHFDRYLIREKVELCGRSAEWSELLLAGPDAPNVIAKLTPGAPFPAARLGNEAVTLAGRAATLVRVELTRPFGCLILCRHDDVAAIWQALADAGAKPCGTDAFETARVESGIPFYGPDIGDKNLPQEVNRSSIAISFVKGCYLGQETVARIDALGHVNKTLAGVRFGGTAVPSAGTELTAGGQPVGQVTSAVFSPRSDAPLALAYLRRGSEAPGTELDCAFGRAEVTALPV